LSKHHHTSPQHVAAETVAAETIAELTGLQAEAGTADTPEDAPVAAVYEGDELSDVETVTIRHRPIKLPALDSVVIMAPRSAAFKPRTNYRGQPIPGSMSRAVANLDIPLANGIVVSRTVWHIVTMDASQGVQREEYDLRITDKFGIKMSDAGAEAAWNAWIGEFLNGPFDVWLQEQARNPVAVAVDTGKPRLVKTAQIDPAMQAAYASLNGLSQTPLERAKSAAFTGR
jgi:hypothetical protein